VSLARAGRCKGDWRRLVGVVSVLPGWRARALGIGVTSLAAAASATASSYTFKGIVDALAHTSRAEGAEVARAVVSAIAAFAILRLTNVALGHLQAWQSNDVFVRLIAALRQRVIETLLRRPLAWYTDASVGDVMDRFAGTGPICVWFSGVIETNLASVLQVIGILVILSLKAPIVAGLLAVTVPAVTVDAYRRMRDARPYRRGWQRLGGQMSALVADVVANIATVRVLGAEQGLLERYLERQAQWREQRDRLYKVNSRSNTRRATTYSAVVTVCLVVVGLGGLAGKQTPGDIVLVLSLVQAAVSNLATLTDVFNEAGEVAALAERLEGLLRENNESTHLVGTKPLTNVSSLEFRNVTFVYPGQTRPAVENVSFSLVSGQRVGLVGRSGAGKSTIIKLLMGLHEPSSGTILVNGRDINVYDRDSVRRKCGVVLQDTALFNDTVSMNVLLGNEEPSAEALRASLELAHAAEIVAHLPNGTETVLGERGARLSGGERQRLAIARAVARDPDLVLLDEATSALDSASEAAVQRGLDALLRGRTSLVVAHRLATVARCDEVLVMDQGRIVQRGPHRDLVADATGLYAQLNRLQLTPSSAHVQDA